MALLGLQCNVYKYDSDKGDPLAGVIAGLAPSEFPESWKCPNTRRAKGKTDRAA